MTSAAAPATNGEDSLVPPDSSTSEDWPLRLTQPAKTGLASQEAKLRSPGASRSIVRPVSVNPLEDSELMLLLSQGLVEK